ncbi:MAG: aminotransferase class I/II-fold pyridoxal phosphate-dependent enzyme [Thermoanaerobaculia bacterium]|nr:aminotransferase class I/II-fold pyridoxal phosphate-dependent enzyme [Thermoanaerobaculia bacterium]
MSLPISRRAFAGTLGAAAGVAILDTPLMSRAAEAAAKAAANRYPDALAEEAREAIAKHHGVAVDQVLLGCGSSEILRMADMAFSGPGRRVVAAEPTFEAVLMFAKVLRADGVKVPLTADFRHDLPKMASACDATTGLVYVCNPNNPTATIVTGDEMAAFAAKVPPSATILVDEAYHHFVEDPRYRSSLELIAKHPNVVVARTFSKIYGMAGLRLGYAVSSMEAIAAMAPYASWSNTNAAVLAAAAASLADPDLAPRQKKLLNDTRKWLVSELTKQGRRTMPSEANFVMVDVGGDVAPVIQAFRAKKILVGRKFPSLPNWLRVTIGKREEVAAFLAALPEIVPAPVRAA